MPTFVGYIRVSSDSQKDNASLPVQEAAIKTYCKAAKIKLFNVFCDIESGESAANREAFNNALAVVYADLADGLIVHKLDRFSRSLLDSESIRAEFEKRGKKLISIMDPVDLGNDDSVLMYQIKQALAERERKEIKKRCQMGREAKDQAGGIIGGPVPYGYLKGAGGEYVPHPEQQKVLKMVNEWIKGGKTCAWVAARLNQMEIPTQRGRRWQGHSIFVLYFRPAKNLERLKLSRLDERSA